MLYLNLFLSLMLVSFAALQWNDPDPLLWISIYFYAAFVTAMAGFKKYISLMIYGGLGFYLAGSLYLLPSVWDWVIIEHGKNFMAKMQDDKIYIEETRECAGLFICGAIMVLHMWSLKNKSKAKLLVS